MVHYILPSVEGVLKLERRCPHCGRNHGRIHSGVRHRRISDLKVQTLPQRRMKCPRCKTTWTVRASGVEAECQRSRRLISLGVVLYMFGLSYRAVEKFLPLLECRGSKSSLDRDVEVCGRRAQELHRQAPRMRVRVLGVDGTGAALGGQDRGVLFLVGIGRGGGLIGLTFKIRAKTMRGFKSMEKVLAHPHLAFFLRGQGGVCDLRRVI